MIDLRSDTVTKPGAQMREAIAQAKVGDDVYGEDPTVNELEQKVAKMFGKEAALFTPTGSLANQLCIRTLVKPGEELLTETSSHIARAELGAAAVFSGITTRTWPSERGVVKAEQPLAIAHPDAGPYLVSTTAIALENTHNFGGGSVQQISEIKKLRAATSEMKVAMHLDGARIWNAHVATKVSFTDYAQNFDTISVCLSKGLGAPAGSLMISTAERVATARIWRKRYGAGLRQVGILAAAGIYALDNNLKFLQKDHDRAKQIAMAVAKVAPKVINPDYVETNIVALDLNSTPLSAGKLSEQLKAEGILSGALGPKFLRLVTHMDITDEQISKVVEVLPNLIQRALVS